MVGQSVGSRIKELRERRDWNQKYLAKKVGINNSVMSRIEANKRPIEDELLKKFCQVFDVSADYLLGIVSAFDRLPHEIKEKADERLDDVLKGLTQTQKEHLASFIDVLQNERD